MAGADHDAFLVPGGASDLLPTNTQIFSSTVRYGKPWYITVWSGTLLAVILAAVAASSSGGGGAKGGLWGGAFAVALVATGISWALGRLYTRQYAASLKAGEWHQGVVCFPSGDVVIRFQGLFSSVDRTIEAAYLSRAQVERRCSPLHLRPRNYLKLYFLQIDARPACVAVCEDDLRDSVVRIAEYINTLKGQQAASHYGFPSAGGFGSPLI